MILASTESDDKDSPRAPALDKVAEGDYKLYKCRDNCGESHGVTIASTDGSLGVDSHGSPVGTP